MNHQPYQDWLIEGSGSLVGSLDRPLTQDEVQSLHDHIQECEECQRLAIALSEVESTLRQAPVIAPQEGFTSRFQVRLAAQQARVHRRQSLLMLGTAISGAILIVGLLILGSLPLVRSSGTLFWVYLYEATKTFAYGVSMIQLIEVVLRTAIETMPFYAWVFGIGVVCFMSVVWWVSYRLALSSRRVNS